IGESELHDRIFLDAEKLTSRSNIWLRQIEEWTLGEERTRDDAEPSACRCCTVAEPPVARSSGPRAAGSATPAATDADVSTDDRAAGEGRRLGSDAAGAGRQDVGHGEGHLAGLRDRSRLWRRPHGHHGGKAWRTGPGDRVQPRHGRP